MNGYRMVRLAATAHILMLLAVAGCAPTRAAHSDSVQQVAYVSVRGDGRVQVYDVDSATGAWAHKQTVAVRDGDQSWEFSAPMAVSPDRRRLHVGLRAEGNIATYEIADDGRLSLLSTSSIAGSATFLSRDPSGRWLLAAYYPEGKVGVYRVNDAGTVAGEAEQEVYTALNAHAILADPTNQYVFVPHTEPNAIYNFLFDAETGRLSPNVPPVVRPPDGRGPRHARFHPVLPVAYFTNELSSTVSAYRFEATRGALTEFQEMPALPADFSDDNTTADLHLTPDGRFLYASNRGHDSIVGYRVDPETGRLDFIDWFEAEPRPRSFAIDLTGRFLYVAGQDSGNVASYRIDPSTGRLARIATYEVGSAPTWIEVVAID
jgi:6-phosphogluconolactonase